MQIEIVIEHDSIITLPRNWGSTFVGGPGVYTNYAKDGRIKTQTSFIVRFRASDDLFHNFGNLRAQSSIQNQWGAWAYIYIISYIIGQLPQCYLQYKGWWQQPVQRRFLRWNCQADCHRFINGDDVSAQVALTADCRVTCFFVGSYRSTQIFL